MASPSGSAGTTARPGSGSHPGMPRWVKSFIAVIVVLVLAFLGVGLLGGDHGPGRHAPGGGPPGVIQTPGVSVGDGQEHQAPGPGVHR